MYNRTHDMQFREMMKAFRAAKTLERWNKKIAKLKTKYKGSEKIELVKKNLIQHSITQTSYNMQTKQLVKQIKL